MSKISFKAQANTLEALHLELFLAERLLEPVALLGLATRGYRTCVACTQQHRRLEEEWDGGVGRWRMHTGGGHNGGVHTGEMRRTADEGWHKS